MRGATADFYVDDAMMTQVIDAKVVHIGGIGLMKKMDKGRNAELMKRAKANGAITTVDIFAGSNDDMPAVAMVLPHTDYFMPSIEEAQALTGLSRHARTWPAFHRPRALSAACSRWARDGAYYHHADGTKFASPAFDIEVKCTCGCGDAFNAGFAVGLCHGFDPETTVRFAQATSALNATGLGSQAGVVDFKHTYDFMGDDAHEGMRKLIL